MGVRARRVVRSAAAGIEWPRYSPSGYERDVDGGRRRSDRHREAAASKELANRVVALTLIVLGFGVALAPQHVPGLDAARLPSRDEGDAWDVRRPTSHAWSYNRADEADDT